MFKEISNEINHMFIKYSRYALCCTISEGSKVLSSQDCRLARWYDGKLSRTFYTMTYYCIKMFILPSSGELHFLFPRWKLCTSTTATVNACITRRFSRSPVNSFSSQLKLAVTYYYLRILHSRGNCIEPTVLYNTFV